MQDEIVVRLASALDAELVRADSIRLSKLTRASAEAEDLAMQCDAASRVRKGETGGRTYELCEEALQADPKNVRALVTLALYYSERVERSQSPDPSKRSRQSEGLGRESARGQPAI
jgi:hypothetical protein